MPVPFDLHYGKVGKIYIEIPIMNLTSAPLKIEISDIFIFIKPKRMENWKEDVEVNAFQQSTINSLNKYENYL